MPATRRSTGGAAAATVAKPTARRPSTVKKTKTIEEMIPLTCTPFYVPPPPPGIPEASSSRRRTSKGKDKAMEPERKELEGLKNEDKTRLLQEIMGFHPRTVAEDISEACRNEIRHIVTSVSGWIETKHEAKTDVELADVDQGPYKLETLLDSHMDKSVDLFIGWCLRNVFAIPEDLRLVLPWHKGLDFDRANFVASLREGETDVQGKIDDLRTQVVEMRKLKYQLDLANKKLDKQVKGLELEKEAAGFVLELAEDAGLAPLPQAADALEKVLNTLSNKLEPFGDSVPPPRPAQTSPGPNIPAGPESKIWEQGRAAYLNWAASGAAGSSTGETGEAGKGRMEKVELDRMKNEVQAVAGADELGKLQDVLSAS